MQDDNTNPLLQDTTVTETKQQDQIAFGDEITEAPCDDTGSDMPMPYPLYEVGDDLKKQFLIMKGQWSPGEPHKIVEPITLLRQVSSALEATFGKYTWFRADVCLTFQFTVPFGASGQMMVSQLPPDHGAPANAITLSGYPSILLDGTNNETTCLRLPWLCQTPLRRTTDSQNGSSFAISNLVPFLASGATTVSPGYTVWAALENLQFAGYNHNVAQSGKRKKMGVRNQNGEAAAKVSNATGETDSTPQLVGMLERVPMIGPVVSGAVKMITGGVGNSIAAVGNKLLDWFGMDKPRDVRFPTPVHIVNHPGGTNGDSMSAATPISITAGCRAAPYNNAAVAIDGPGDQMSISRIAQTPMITQITALSNDYSTVIPIGAHTTSYLTAMASLFRFFRGSFKVHLRFVAPSNASGKVRVRFAFNNIGTTNDALPSIVADVTGTTDIYMRVPMAPDRVWKPVDEQVFLHIDWLNPVRDTTAAALDISVIVIMAGGEDIEFNRARQTLMGQGPMRSEFTGEFTDICGELSSITSSGQAMSDDRVDSLRTLLHCPIPVKPITLEDGEFMRINPLNIFRGKAGATIYNTNHYQICLLFQGWRGSFRMFTKYTGTITYGSEVVCPILNHDDSNTTYVDVEFPYWANEFYTLMDKPEPVTDDYNKQLDVAAWAPNYDGATPCYVSAGDDFSCMVLIPDNLDSFTIEVEDNISL